MQNRAELQRATEKFQNELAKATRELQEKTIKVENAERNIPILTRDIQDLREQLQKKETSLISAKKDLELKHEVGRLSLEMKRLHQEQNDLTRNQAMALKESGVHGVRYKF